MLYLFVKLFLAKFYFTDYHRDNKAIASSYTINYEIKKLLWFAKKSYFL